MKKRLISVLLTLCLVVALVPCLTITAAAADTITYTLKSGDTVYGVCKANGIDFYANMNWIMRANNISNFNKLPVGKVLTLPAPGTTPSLNDLTSSSSGSGSTGSTGSTGTTGGNLVAGGTGGVASGNLLSGDYVTEYLVYHTMASGETVGALCNQYGIDFAANSDRIMKLNNIKSYNRIAVGKTLLLPATSLPSSGSCIRVVAHRVASGETAIGICNSYGISYASNASLMQALNNNANLATIRAGQTLLVPVMSTITNGSVDGGAGTGTGTTTGSNNNSSNSSGSTDTAATYKVNKKTVNANYGSYAISSTTAKEGATVTVKTSPKTNYALGSVSVYNDTTGDPVDVSYSGSNASFKMPASDVTVSVNFTPAKQYDLKLTPADNGDYRTYVNGVKTRKAMEGQRVTIQTVPDAKYELDEITYYNSKGAKIGTADWDDSFIMPGENVTVKVTFKKMTTYKINYTAQGDHGQITVTLNGKKVTEAMSGDTIKITAMPDDGFSVGSLKVTRKVDGAKIALSDSNTFVMPRSDVDITVSYSSKAYDINTTVGEHGSYTVSAGDGTPYTAKSSGVTTTSGSGIKIKLDLTPEKGYEVDDVRVTKVSTGSRVTVDQEIAPTTNSYTFDMPADDVNVSVTFRAKAFKVTAEASDANSLFKISSDLGSADAVTEPGADITANVDSNVVVKAWPDTLKAGYVLKSITVKTAGGDTITCPVSADGTSGSFVMPADNVTVSVQYQPKGLTITTVLNLKNNAKGSYTVQVNSKEPVEWKKGGKVNAAVTDTVTIAQINVTPGYTVTGITVKNAAGEDVPGVSWNTFTMPAYDVTVTVTIDKYPLDVNTAFDGGDPGWIYSIQVGKNAKIDAVSGKATTALVGETVTVYAADMYLEAGRKIDSVTVVTGHGETVKVTMASDKKSASFNMPGDSVTITLKYTEQAT